MKGLILIAFAAFLVVSESKSIKVVVTVDCDADDDTKAVNSTAKHPQQGGSDKETAKVDPTVHPPRNVTAKTSTATQRYDCYPEAKGDKTKVDKTECLSQGCIFDATVNPPCFRLEMKNSFKFTQTWSLEDGLGGILASAGDENSLNKWKLNVQYINDNLLRFSMNSHTEDRYTVPVPLNLPKQKLSRPKYEFRITEKDGIDFQIIRKDTKDVIWDLETTWNGLILTDQLLQITTRLPSTNVYGLGEHRHGSFRHKMDVSWPSFARDQPPSFDNEANLYGVHPFYTCVEDSRGNTHGVFLFNSNGQEYAFSGRPSLTFRTIGGILDFFVFMGPTPEEVIQQYTQVIGRPMMPPYWGLGYQQSRYGYNNIGNLRNAVDTTRHYNIPHDVQYVDIDHMEEQKDFTINKTRFPGLNDYFKSLQDDGMRIIYLLDPCLIALDDYEPYKMMKAADGAIKWSSDVTVPDSVKDSSGALLGFVWPKKPVIFPDFFKESARNTWKKLIKNYRSNLTFDGLWIDMNEPASFGTNEERPWNWPESKKPYWTLRCPNNTLEDPPYRPLAAHRWDNEKRSGRLSDKTICLSAAQGEKQEYRHYDVHSLFGWSQTRPTLEAAREATGERSVIITRSTFPGSGQSAGHWLGDNVSQWPDLHSSIIGMLEFNLFGIPYIGADICGFFNNATESLCKRWMQLGAFYPFCRNHNTIGAKDQGPGQLGDAVGNASAEIITIRYRLLPYLYTLFHQAHSKGSTVVRPLHHEFPTDPVALSIDKQFLWGSCFLISPILEKDQKVLSYYLPPGRWYNYLNHEMRENPFGQWHSIAVDESSKPELFVREGCILVEQEPANNTHFSRQNPLAFLVALDQKGMANGYFFWDDGVSIDTYEKGNYFSAGIKVINSSMRITVEHQVRDNPDWQNLTVNQIVVLGVTETITNVKSSNGLHNVTFSQNQAKREFTISLQNVRIAEINDLVWN